MNVTVFIIVSWFLGLCGTFDVLRQPTQAFRAAEHSKSTWLAVEVAGTLLSFTGIFTWAAYSFWVRPSVVRAGGRRRVFIRTFFQSLNSAAKQSRTPSRSTPNGSSGSKPAQPCSSCGGAGSQTCFACQGRGRHDSSTSSAYAPHAVDGWCAPCGGSGKTRCQTCSGTGKRSY